MHGEKEVLVDFKYKKLIDSHKWRAKIKFNGKDLSLGYFDTDYDAALVFNGAAKLLYGEFAWLNKIT